MKRPHVIRFAIEVPRIGDDVVDMHAVLWDARLTANAERTRAGMLEGGFSPAEADTAAELVFLGAVEVLAELTERGQA